MKKITKLAVVAAMAFGTTYEVATTYHRTPLTAHFTEQSAGTIAHYRLPSLIVPENKKDLWCLRLGSWEMAGGGHHTYLEFSPYERPTDPRSPNLFQIHGIAMDKVLRETALLDLSNTDTYKRCFRYELKAMGVNEDYNETIFHKKADSYVDIFYGTRDEVLKLYMDAMKLVDYMNAQTNSYNLFTQNSNSMQCTLLHGLGFSEPDLYEPDGLAAIAKGYGRFWVPGFAHNLLPEGWDRQQARAQGGYDRLRGNDLTAAANQVSIGTRSIYMALQQ